MTMFWTREEWIVVIGMILLFTGGYLLGYLLK